MPALALRPFAVALLALAAAALAPTRAAAATAAHEAAMSEAQLQRQAQRERIQTERKALQAQRVKEEAACYQQFVVEDCLRGVRAKAREADNALRRQELQLNDADRREKAGQRLRSIEERQQEQRQKLEAGERPAPMHGAPRGGPQAREQDAAQRAEQQRRHAAEHAAELERRRQSLARRMSESRADYEAKQQLARERRERHERQQAEAAASGRKPAASLPVPGGDAKP